MSFPKELKKDDNDLMYIEDNMIINYPLYFKSNDFHCKKVFYQIPGSNEYIVKYENYNQISQEALFNMLERFERIKSNIKNIDFPIGYFKNQNNVKGTIIYYYQSGLSLKNVLANNEGLENLKKYYQHDDNMVHNLFLMLLDILDLIEEMYQNKVYYYDINCTNFILDKNAIKVIDFEPFRVGLKSDDDTFDDIIRNYILLCEEIFKRYTLDYFKPVNIVNNFEDVKKYTKKIEMSNQKRYFNGI